MEIDRMELKRRAREAMYQTSPRFWVVALAYLLVLACIGLTDYPVIYLTADPDTGFSFLGLFVSILAALLSDVFTFGFQLWSLWTWRKLDPNLGALTQGFSVAGRVIIMRLLIALRLILWGMLLTTVLTAVAVPAIILSYQVAVVILFAVCLAAFAFMIAIQLRYAMTPYLLADHPDDGPGAAVARSVELMRGHKWELFKLQFSFFGWYLIQAALTITVYLFLLAQGGTLLSITSVDPSQAIQLYLPVINSLPAFLLTNLLTLPLALWLTPYTGVAEAGFYDTLLRIPRYDAQEMPPV